MDAEQIKRECNYVIELITDSQVIYGNHGSALLQSAVDHLREMRDSL